MVQVNEIKAEDIKGVLYLDSVTKGQIDGVRFFFVDGTSHSYHGDDLARALAVAKQRFRPEPEENRMADQPVKE